MNKKQIETTLFGREEPRPADAIEYSPYIDSEDPLCLVKNRDQPDLIVRKNDKEPDMAQEALKEYEKQVFHESDAFLAIFIKQLQRERDSNSPHLQTLESRAMLEQRFRHRIVQCSCVDQLEQLVDRHMAEVNQLQLPTQEELDKGYKQRCEQQEKQAEIQRRIQALKEKQQKIAVENLRKYDTQIIRNEIDARKTITEEIDVKLQLNTEQKNQKEMVSNRLQLLTTMIDDLMILQERQNASIKANDQIIFWRVPDFLEMNGVNIKICSFQKNMDFTQVWQETIAEAGRIQKVMERWGLNQQKSKNPYAAQISAAVEIFDAYLILLEHTSQIQIFKKTVMQMQQFITSFILQIQHDQEFFSARQKVISEINSLSQQQETQLRAIYEQQVQRKNTKLSKIMDAIRMESAFRQQISAAKSEYHVRRLREMHEERRQKQPLELVQ